MPLKRNKPGRIPSKKERQRIKSANPRVGRRVTRKRILNDRAIRERFLEIFPLSESPAGSVVYPAISKGDPRIRGVGKERLVVHLGVFVGPKGKKVHLLGKVFRTRDEGIDTLREFLAKGELLDPFEVFLRDKPAEFLDENYAIIHRTYNSPYYERNTLRRIASLRIPTVFSKVVKTDPKSSDVFLIVEDLSQGGRFQVRDFHGIRPAEISNHADLEAKFQDYKHRMEKAGVRISIGHEHAGIENLEGEIRKTFFVVIDPKTKKGRLVAGDADQIDF